MPSAAVAIPAGASLIGGAMASRGAQKAANTAANAQRDAAAMAAEAQKFRPVGITSRFGTSQFTMGPEGYLESAGYTASPEIQALQDRLSAIYGTSLSQAEEAAAMQPGISAAGRGLFGLGQQYLAESPDAARQRFMNQQYALLDPVRQREEQRLGAGVFGRGRAGLNVGDIGQPELFALASARRQQDLELARQAEAAAQQQTAFGTGLLGQGIGLQQSGYGLQTAALGPFQSQFGLTQLLEQAAQQPLDIGAQLGGGSATAGANVGQSLLAGGQAAANLRLQGDIMGQSLQANAMRDILGNRQLQQGLFGGIQQMASPMIYGSSNVYGPYGTGTVPTLNPNPAFNSPAYFAQDI